MKTKKYVHIIVVSCAMLCLNHYYLLKLKSTLTLVSRTHTPTLTNYYYYSNTTITITITIALSSQYAGALWAGGENRTF